MDVERDELDELVRETYGTRDYEILGATRLMWPDHAVALVRLSDGSERWVVELKQPRPHLTPWRLRARLKVYRQIIAQTEALLELAGEASPPSRRHE